MKSKVTWYILTNDDGSITIASTNGVRVSVTDRNKAREAMWKLVSNTADVFYSLIQRRHKEIKFTVEY